MKKRVLRYLSMLLGLGVVGAAVVLFVALRPLSVEVTSSQQGVLVQVFGLGTVEARIVSRPGFEIGATLMELYADHGDLVQQGAVLARLQSTEQEARVARTLAGVVNAQAAVKMAEAAVGKATAVLAQRQQTNRRTQALLARQTVSLDVAEEAQMEQDVAAADLSVALSEVDLAQAALQDARAQHDYEQVLLDQHVLRAPYDAMVVQRHQELGAVLTAGEALFTLVAPETVWVLAHVDEARAGDIRLGQQAEVRLRSLPRQAFQGRVARIGLESDRVSEERRVYIACDRCPERFVLGEQAEVIITTAVLDEAVLVPETAVAAFDGAQGTVWTVDNGALQRRQVTFGRTTLDARLEVTGGLAPGAQVVTVLRPGMREGRAVSVAGKDT